MSDHFSLLNDTKVSALQDTNKELFLSYSVHVLETKACDTTYPFYYAPQWRLMAINPANSKHILNQYGSVVTKQRWNIELSICHDKLYSPLKATRHTGWKEGCEARDFHIID